MALISRPPKSAIQMQHASDFFNFEPLSLVQSNYFFVENVEDNPVYVFDTEKRFVLIVKAVQIGATDLHYRAKMLVHSA